MGDWIAVKQVAALAEVKKLQERFGPGESEAIILAQELRATLFADEATVIREARNRQIPVISTLAMLLEAKNKNFIEKVKDESYAQV